MMSLKIIIKSMLFAAFLVVAPTLNVLPSNFVGASVAEAAVIQRIDVKGNRRMDADTVISYLTISPGDNVSNFDIDASVKSLYATELFSDVSIYRQGSVLIVEIDENATVNKVFFEGNSRLKDPVLEAAVKVRAQAIYSDEKAADDVELIKIAYGRVGKSDAEVSYEVVPLENNRVNVIYRINEGGKTKITQIIFVGNQTFGERRLKEVISTKESGLFSFLSTSDIYDPARLNADQEKLRTYYYNKGFADFQILSVDADLNESENEYTITITMEEGSRYTFGEIDIDSTIPDVGRENLLDLIETIPGEHYSAAKVEKSIIAITERVAEFGHAFVEVVPRGDRNFETNTIDILYLVDEGARVYIEDIQILGNDRTRDYVIRREFDLSEGDAYNQVLIQKTRTRLLRLGFFDSVDVSTRPGSEPDKVDVIVKVKESSTGEFSLGGGYSTNGGASVTASFSERNFLGRGQFFRLEASRGEDEQSYGVSFSEPYFLGYRVSAGFNVKSTQSDATSDRNYAVDSTSGTITFGIPLTEELSSKVFYTINNSDTSINPALLDTAGTQGDAVGELSAALVPAKSNWMASGFGYNLTYIDVDNKSDPRDGYYLSLSQTAFGAGGDAQYLKTQGVAVAYKTLSEEADLIAFGRVRAGNLTPFNTAGMRTLDNFNASSKSIRGFEPFGYGPRDPITGDALGGRNFWNATAEVQFPLPFVPTTYGFRGAVFADAGMLFDPGNPAIAIVTANNTPPGLPAGGASQLDDNGIRSSAGASIIWASPFGPLRVDYAFPIMSETYDQLQEFTFGVSKKF